MELKKMQDIKEETASVVVFPAGPSAGWQGFADLERAVREDIADACSEAGVVMADAADGKGDFSERLAGVFARAFDQGGDLVLVVFSDTVGLTGKRVAQAVDVLKRYGGMCLGPSQDDRFYLLGLSRDAFDPDYFAHLSGDEPGSFADMMMGFGDKIKAPTLLPGQGRAGDEARARELAGQTGEKGLAGTRSGEMLLAL